MSKNLFEKITSQTILLTANSRLTRYLQTQFDQHQRAQGLITWETPKILPLQSWLEQQFHKNNFDDQLLLTRFQEECLWHDIVTKSKLDLLQPSQMSKLVKQAYDILLAWEVTLDVLEPFSSQNEVRFLIDWMTAFQKMCQEKKWITTSQLPQFIQSNEKRIILPQKIILIGFDELNPNIKSLITTLEKKCIIETETFSANTIEKKRIVLDNTENEIKTAALWLKTQYEKNPSGKFGCVVPDLEKMRSTVLRIFSCYFSPEQINLSAGISLAQHKMIDTALSALKWCHSDIPIVELSLLLQSPYLCLNEDEKNAGAQMDALLRKQNKMQVSIADIYSVAPILQSRYPNLNIVSRWRAFIHHYHQKKLEKCIPSEWTTHFIEALRLIEWPGNHTQNTAEFQVLERFKKVLFSFSQLDFLFGKIDFRHALYLLTTLTQQTVFQAKSHDEPIQIMGALEASGIIFDSLWVVGLDDNTWPPATKPHPLIPHSIQQQYHMPHATAKRELQFCENMTKRLENAADYVIFSSPASEGEKQLFPSKLIEYIPAIDLTTLSLPNTLSAAEKIFHERKTESFYDNQAPIITDFSNIRGGNKILDLQAACPFRAFATIRLNANALEQPIVGITPATKGTLVHDILFKIWDEISDQQLLNTLTDETLNQLIQSNIEKTFCETDYQKNQPHNHYFFSIEKKRLSAVIKDWLLVEKKRPYFRVIEREKECAITIKNLPIKIRLDRIDQLSDGSLFLIDYKTGSNNKTTGWFQERLTNAQLPLYVAFQNAEQSSLTGMSYAQVSAGKMEFIGVIHENHLYTNEDIDKKNKIMKLVPANKNKQNETILSWENLVTHWKHSLEKLADDFCMGVAMADPVEKNTCETCDLMPICRYKRLTDNG